MNVSDLIGKRPSADELGRYLGSLSSGTPALDVKTYSDVVYFNYASLGVSFQFSPQNGYRPALGIAREQLRDADLQLGAIDIYNGVDELRSTVSAYPRLPVELRLGMVTITITKDSTGKEFVGWLGEPDRKGGGTGPSSGSINIWCEWSRHGLMVEFGGSEARGPQAWERGADAVWRVATVFEPKSS